MIRLTKTYKFAVITALYLSIISTVLGLIFFKLVTYYFYRAKDDDSENFYLNLIADLMIKSKGYSKNKKSEIILSRV